MNNVECMLSLNQGYDQNSAPEEKIMFVRYAFAYAYIWSICSSVTPTEKQLEKLDGFWKEYFDELNYPVDIIFDI